MDRGWTIVLGLVVIMATVVLTAEKCNDGLTNDEALKMKNTIERLDSDMDKVKARKCKCKK
jgi:hypothetical protein